MAAFTKYHDTVEQMWLGTHNLSTATVNISLASDAPSTSDDELADTTQPTGTGYAPIDIVNTMSESGGTATLAAGGDQTWTAGAGDWTAATYVILYNDTSSGDKLLGYWSYGSPFVLANGETFTVDFGSSVATLV